MRGELGPTSIAQITRAFYIGGAENQVLRLIKGLKPFYDVRVAVVKQAGPWIESLWKGGFIPAEFPLATSLLHPVTLRQIYRLSRWLVRNRVKLVHSHDFYATLMAVPASRLAGLRVVVSRFDMGHWYGRAQRTAIRLVTRAADHVVANADAVREMLIKNEGMKPDRISVIRNGIDLVEFDRESKAPLEKTHLPSDSPVIVLVANMNPVKRHEDFLRAVALLKNKGLIFHAVLVGDGPRRLYLEQLSDSFRLQECVHFLGLRRDVPALWRRATLGVLCSTAEGLSNAIIEGMAAGVPMVVTDAGGNTELVADQVRGIVVKPKSPSALAAAIEKLLLEAETRRAMAAAARDFVASHLSQRHLIDHHRALYSRLLGEPNPTGDLSPPILAEKAL